MAMPASVLIGTTTGLVDATAGRAVAHLGHDVVAVAGPWAVVNGHEVVAADGRRAPPIEAARVACLAQLGGGEVLAGTAGAHVYRAGDGTVERLVSFDDAEGRDRWYTPWGGPPAVRAIAVSPAGTVLANVHVGGILRSDDGCATWRATIDIDLDVHQVVAGDGPALAASAAGLAESRDDGLTWRVVDEGLESTYARAVAVSGGTVLLSASDGPMGERAALYRRPLTGGRPFERCRAGLPEWFEGNVDTFWLDGLPDGGAAFVSPGGQVYASADEGATWELLADAIAGPHCLSLAGA
jgi:hypothetical protein